MKFSVENYGDFANAGRCHVQVSKFDENGEPKSGAHIVSLEILASTNPEDVGKIFKDYVPDPANSPKSVFRMIEFLVGAGVVTRQQIKAAQDSNTDLDLSPSDCVGRQLYVELAEEEYNGKTTVKVKGGRSYFTIGDPKCKDWPVNRGMLERATKSRVAATESASAPSPF